MKSSMILEALNKDNMKSYFDDIMFEEKNKAKWISRLHDLSISNLEKWVDAAIAKYSSQKYKNKEYRLGRSPRKDLYWLFLDYIVKYGQDLHEIDVRIDINNDCPFPNVKYIFDKYSISCMYGQETSIDIVKL